MHRNAAFVMQVAMQLHRAASLRAVAFALMQLLELTLSVLYFNVYIRNIRLTIH